MKNQILKGLYSGSLIPVERQIVKDSEMDSAMNEMVKAEELLQQADEIEIDSADSPEDKKPAS